MISNEEDAVKSDIEGVLISSFKTILFILLQILITY